MCLQNAYRLTEDILIRGSCELGENNLAAFLIEKHSFHLLNEDVHVIKICMLTDINILHYSWRFTVFTQLLRTHLEYVTLCLLRPKYAALLFEI
jgi:hypothetical protein